MGVGDAAKELKTVFNGFGRGEIRGGLRKPLETVALSLRRRDTPMNGGVNQTARKLIMRIAATQAPGICLMGEPVGLRSWPRPRLPWF